MSEGRLIKRYANRKLYDTANSRYVTLDEVAALLQAGEDVHIVDNQTKADITAVTMAQILVEEEKRGRKTRRRPEEPHGAMPALRQLLQRRIAEPVQQIRTTVEESVSRLLKTEAAYRPEAKAETKQELKPEPKPEPKPDEGRGGLLDELQRRLDEGVKHLVPGLDAFTRLQKQVAELSTRLDRIEALLGLPPVDADEP